MGGAKNCPETPRQKMIAMMYLVLTAMLALNVSAEILKGFKMVDDSLQLSIKSASERSAFHISKLKDLEDLNEKKVGDWLNQALSVKAESDKLYDYIVEFKYEMVKMADRDKANKNAIADGTYVINKQDDTNASSVYAITQKKGYDLQKEIENYREFVKKMFGNDKDKNAEYDRIFSTANVKTLGASAKSLNWVEYNFQSMPLAAAFTMLTKYQSDVRATESDLVQYLRGKVDADDFRVNKIFAAVIPESKNVVQGGTYKAQIILAASDTTASPEIFIGGTPLTNEDGWYIVNAGQIGTHKYSGEIKLKDAVTGKENPPYPFESEYSVVAPSATIANQDMNVVYMNYNNRMSVSVPGFSSDKINVSSPNASMEKTANGLYICKPKSYDNVVISVTANVEGRTISMGSQTFRVKTLPNPTVFLRYTNAAGEKVTFNPIETPSLRPKRAEIVGADVVAEYADGLLQANFSVQSFTLLVADGRGGFNPTNSDGKNFSGAQKTSLQTLKPGSKVILERVKVTGAKTATLTFPVFDLP